MYCWYKIDMKITQNKHFPEADTWMWNYCHYLGSIRDNNGKPFDLGVWVSQDKKQISFAIVDGPEGGDYHSGSIYVNNVFQTNILNWLSNPNLFPHQVTFKLAQNKGFFEKTLHHIDLNNLHKYHSNVSDFIFNVSSDKECIAVFKDGRKQKIICSRDNSVHFRTAVELFDAETFEDVSLLDIYYIEEE